MPKNTVRTSRKVASKAGRALQTSKSKTVKSIAASALGNRRKSA